MTDRNQRIAELRQQNYSYSFIGKVLSLSPNTVKSICRRKNFDASAQERQRPRNYTLDSVKTVVQYCRLAESWSKSSAPMVVAVNGGRLIAGLQRNRLDFTLGRSDECVRR